MRPEKLARQLTSWARVLPDFIIIGGQKCGTSSLYHYLVQHPCVAPAQKKEVHFFDLSFHRGLLWYRARFAPVWSRWLAQVRGQRFVTGEASPDYIFNPHASRRVFQTVPQVKLIALLRNPVDRAYSRYHRAVEKGRESLSFEEAIQKEAQRPRDKKARLLLNGNYRSAVRSENYLARGIYADQLEAWLSLFPRRQILILKSEDFFADSSATLERVFRFLDLPNREIQDRRQYNKGSYPEMEPATRRWLLEYFAPHNERLYRLLGEDFAWDR